MGNKEYLTILIHFSGKYKPNKFLADYKYPYKIIHEINTIAKIGKDKGKLSKRSFCYFEIGNGIEHNKKIRTAVQLAIKIKKDAKVNRIKIEYFSFRLHYTGIQGNMELSKNEIKWLNKLNCGIGMQYSQDENV
jgi:hypothetical protein